jgi:hypothetical protein
MGAVLRSGVGPVRPGRVGARQFSLSELAQATKNFAEANLVGAGSFGLVYKGLLLDGAPRQDLADEVVRCRRCVPVPYC